MTSFDSPAAINWPLSCPSCHVPLEHVHSGYRCAVCGSVYAANGRVIDFVGADAFYEGRYATSPLTFVPKDGSLLGKIWLYQYCQHYLWYVAQHVPRGGRLLDVAGGAGMRYLGVHWRVAGLEVSSVHALEMTKHYELALHADAMSIPLETASLDAVVSRFFLEHVRCEDKAKLLSEFGRVLKPGGWLITMQDCECDNRLWRWARRDANLFREHFIENDGHYGLMYPSANLQLFEQTGFEVVKHHAPNKTPLVTPSMLEWMQSYRSKSGLANALLGGAHFVYRNRWLSHAYSIIMTLWDDVVERLLPLDHARYLVAVCQKR